jgi:hypothetical protein
VLQPIHLRDKPLTLRAGAGSWPVLALAPEAVAAGLAPKMLAPEKLSPEDFRVHESGDKGRGADVDLVGPGPAYERWQKTPAYQARLKDTRAQK